MARPVAPDDRGLSCVRAFVDDAHVDLSWSEEATALRRGAEEFGPSLDEGLADRDRAGVFDRELWRRCAEFGVLGLPILGRYAGCARRYRGSKVRSGESCGDCGTSPDFSPVLPSSGITTYVVRLS